MMSTKCLNLRSIPAAELESNKGGQQVHFGKIPKLAANSQETQNLQLSHDGQEYHQLREARDTNSTTQLPRTK